MSKSRTDKGFTLIELVVTVAIVSLLASVVVPMAEVAVQRNKETELRLALREIRNGIDAYKQAMDEGKMLKLVGKSGYPPSLKLLVEGVTDESSPDKKQKMYFLRRIPRDPTFLDSAKPAEETWGKRSYASSPESPEEGDDVFDVYSIAAGVGLNGIPYKNW